MHIIIQYLTKKNNFYKGPRAVLASDTPVPRALGSDRS